MENKLEDGYRYDDYPEDPDNMTVGEYLILVGLEDTYNE